MNTRTQAVLLSIIAIMACLGFAVTQLLNQEASLLRQAQVKIAGMQSVTSTNIAGRKITSGYSFECATTTALYRVYSTGERELVADHIETLRTNEHPGDCFEIVSSDHGDSYYRAQKLYLLQYGEGDAGPDGYFVYDLTAKTLQRSRLEYPGDSDLSISGGKLFDLSLGAPDADGEIRSLRFIDFTSETTGTIARLPKAYSYVKSEETNELEGGVTYGAELTWSYNEPTVSVFSAQDSIVECGFQNPGPCKLRVPVFKLYIDPGDPSNEQEVKVK